jgi:hypothetical protein
MVKVLRSFVRGPLEPHIIGFAEDLLRRGWVCGVPADEGICRHTPRTWTGTLS